MNLQDEEAARKILEAFKHRQTNFKTLRDIARQAGFQGAHKKIFKAGINFLIKKGILRVCQSGWKSEKRGGRNHLKAVILLTDIYEFDGESCPLSDEAPENYGFIKKNTDKRKNKKGLERFLRKWGIGKCEKCKSSPVVYLTEEWIPLCKKHWVKLTYGGHGPCW